MSTPTNLLSEDDPSLDNAVIDAEIIDESDEASEDLGEGDDFEED